MRKRKFDPEQDIKIVIEYQSVNSELEMSMKRPDLGDLDIRNKRIEQGAYSCLDEFAEALWNDDARRCCQKERLSLRWKLKEKHISKGR